MIENNLSQRERLEKLNNTAKNELIVVDAYADNTILDIVKRLNIKVIYDSTFHDRYFILDKKDIYHCGASINRIGYKTFSINLIRDSEVYNVLINRINKIM